MGTRQTQLMIHFKRTYGSVFIFLGLFFSSTIATNLQAQTYELGVVFGGSNYIGDVGNTTYLGFQDMAYGVIGKWNKTRRYTFRSSIVHFQISEDDLQGDLRRQARGFAFSNSLTELSLGIEFNFLDWNMYSYNKSFSPYVYTGVTALAYGKLNLGTISNDVISSRDQGVVMAVPMIVGVKASLSHSLVIGAEIGARYTFTDNLDASYSPLYESTRFGNLNNNDWYLFAGLTLTYTWGDLPCFCTF